MHIFIYLYNYLTFVDYFSIILCLLNICSLFNQLTEFPLPQDYDDDKNGNLDFSEFLKMMSRNNVVS